MYTGLMLQWLFFGVFYGFCCGRFSFVKVRKRASEILSYKGNKLAKIAFFGVHNLDAFFLSAQLGITLAVGWVDGEPAIAGLVKPLLELLSINKPACHSFNAIVISFICITFMHVGAGRAYPKSLAIQQAERIGVSLAVPLKIFYFSVSFCVHYDAVSRHCLHFFWHTQRGEAEERHSREELRIIINTQAKTVILLMRGRMLNNILIFIKKKAKDVMIPP